MERVKITIIIVLGAMTFCSKPAKAQDIAFSQFYANPLYLNPALAGSKICPRATLNYRLQWPGISPYKAYSVSYDLMVSEANGGLGGIITSTNSGNGTLNTLNAGLIYSYRLQASKYLTFNAAFQAGYLENHLNPDKLLFEDQIDPLTGQIVSASSLDIPAQTKKGGIDFSAGFLFGYRERAYLGGSVSHLTKPDVGFNDTYRMPMRFTAHAGMLIDLEQGFTGNDKENISVSPNILYLQQDNFHQLNLGAYLNMMPFVGGVWFRHNFENPDAMIVMLGLQKEKYKVGYSFDFTVSKLGMNTTGSHELSLTWLFACPKKTYKYKAIKCPQF
jgi:type IX secretion system PorP/SprF family membrane protein